jgi:hypothetical protein
MRNITVISCSIFVAFSMFFTGKAYSVPTKWEIIDNSLSELLDNGWQLVGIASNRAAYRNSFGPGGVDDKEYIISITKNRKYVICVVPNPTPPVAPAGCRRIN